MKEFSIAAFVLLLVGSTVVAQDSAPNLDSISKNLIQGLSDKGSSLGNALKGDLIKAGLEIVFANDFKSKPFPSIHEALEKFRTSAGQKFVGFEIDVKQLAATAINQVKTYSLSLTDDAQIQECTNIVNALNNIRTLDEVLSVQLNSKIFKLLQTFESGYKNNQSNDEGISGTALEGLVNNLKDSVMAIVKYVTDLYNNLQCNKDPVCTINGVADIVQKVYNLQ